MSASKHVWVRSSSMPKALLCPQSIQPSALEVEDDLSAARLGSCIHEMLEWHIRLEDEEAPHALKARILSKWGILSEQAIMECNELVQAGKDAWRVLRPNYPNPQLEQPVRCALMAHGVLLEITGHIDVLAQRGENTIAVLDWKSGREEFGYEEQVQTYGYLVWRQQGAPDACTIECTLCFLRSGNIITRRYGDADLKGLEDRIIQRLGAEGETYAPGEHCSRCSRRLSCVARQAWLHDGVKVFSDGDPENHATAFGQAKAMKKSADSYLKALKTEVEGNGAIPTVGGKQIELVPHGRGMTLKEVKADD